MKLVGFHGGTVQHGIQAHPRSDLRDKRHHWNTTFVFTIDTSRSCHPAIQAHYTLRISFLRLLQDARGK
jgi:hypothetical protein